MGSLPFSGVSASDLLQGSCSGVMGVPLRSLGRSRIGAGIRRRDTVVMAAPKLRKGKRNHEYPWPKNADEIDPDVKGGYSSYLSHFKPLKERPKPVTLPFEKPLLDLEKKITDVRKMANETGLDFSDQIISLEAKYQQAIKDLYTHLTPIQRVSIARHPNRPTFLDHVLNITETWVELHGDRAGYDDPAIVTGIGSINGRSYMFIGHQKGRNTKENIKRNFGMPTPHGYRKALRMMYYADHHKLPIITMVDTPGAFADLKSEELGQGEAIAFNLRTMFSLKVPIVSIIIGEGGSGGALAIACANKMLMLENSVFYVASPEACAAILWKSAKAAPKAAEMLKITATELCKLKIADGVIPEPIGGAHADPSWTSQQIKLAIVKSMSELMEMDTPELLNHRGLKFRSLKGYTEDKNLDPSKKVNMKKRDKPIICKEKLDAIPELALDQVEKMKHQILNSKHDPLSATPDSDVNKMLETLKKEIDKEYAEAAKTMGLKDRIEILRNEVMKAKGSQKQLTDPALLDEIEKLKEEFKQGLSNYPNLSSLKYKLDTLKEISQAKKISEENGKIIYLNQEFKKRLKAIVERDDVKEKINMLKTDISNAGVSKASDIDDELKEKIVNVRKEIESELSKTLNSLNLEVTQLVSKAKTELPISSDIKGQVAELNHTIKEKIEDAINSSDLKRNVELLKLEVAKSGETHDAEAKRKIKGMKQEIKQSLAKALNLPSMVERYEKIKKDIAKGLTSSSDEQEDSSGRSNGSLNHDAHGEGDQNSDTSNAHGEGDQNSDTSNIEIDIAAKNS